MPKSIFDTRRVKINNSKIYTCEGRSWRCLGKFIKTRGRDQKYCLGCLRLASPAPDIAVRQGEAQTNGNNFLNIDSHFAEASVSTTGGSAGSGERKITDKQREHRRLMMAEYRKTHLERIRTINRDYARRKRMKV